MPERVSGRSGPPSGGRVSGTPAACVSIAVAAAYRGTAPPGRRACFGGCLPWPGHGRSGRSPGARSVCSLNMTAAATHPGAALGLPPSGRGSLASWRARFAALVVDWAASMVVAVALFGVGVMREGGWRAWMIMAVYFVQKSVLTWLASGSFGQLIARIAVVQVGGGPIGPWRALARSAMVCLVVPAAVVGADRRGLDDIVLDTVVVNRAEGREA